VLNVRLVTSLFSRNAPLVVVIALLTGVFAVRASAQATDYLQEMPSAERVIAPIDGDDVMDRRARQIAALNRLYEFMREMAGNRASTGPFPNAVEKPIADDYRAVIGKLTAEGIATFGGVTGMESPRARWMASIQRYQTSRRLYDDLMQRYFSPATRAQHRAALGERAAQSAAGAAMIEQGRRELAGIRDSRWERMTTAEQNGAMQFGALMLLLLSVAAAREALPFRVADGGAAAVLRAGLRRYKLDWFSGVVTAYSARDKRTTTIYERRLASGAITEVMTTTALRTEEFDLVQPDGQHHVTFTYGADANSNMTHFGEHAGTTITAVWGIRRWRKTGPYLVFYLPGLEPPIGPRYGTGSLQRILSPRVWSILPTMGLGFLLGSSTDFLGDLIPIDGSLFRGLAVALLALVPWLIAYFAIDVLRQRRFHKNELPKIYGLVHGSNRGV
jgi:hypothetical protein